MIFMKSNSRAKKEIICVLCQGADEKTCVTDKTENVLYYAYAVPGVDSQYIDDGLKIVAETIVQFGNGSNEFLEFIV